MRSKPKSGRRHSVLKVVGCAWVMKIPTSTVKLPVIREGSNGIADIGEEVTIPDQLNMYIEGSNVPIGRGVAAISLAESPI